MKHNNTQVNARMNEVEEKFDRKLNEIEHQVKDKVGRNEFNHLENQFKKQIESVYEKNLMKETYDKRLKLLIHGLEESETNAWETKDQTTKIFHDFLTKGLQIDPISMNIIDISSCQAGVRKCLSIKARNKLQHSLLTYS